MHIAHHASAIHLRQCLRLGRDGHWVACFVNHPGGELGKEVIGFKINRAYCAGSAILCKGAAQGYPVVGNDLACLWACGTAVCVDAGNTQVSQREKFIGCGGAVLVEVAPDTQVCIGFIGAGHETVNVGVKLSQGIKAVSGQAAVVFNRVYAEEFSACVYLAIAVQVAHQKAIIRFCPACTGLDAVGVMVEQDCA